MQTGNLNRGQNTSVGKWLFLSAGSKELGEEPNVQEILGRTHRGTL